MAIPIKPSFRPLEIYFHKMSQQHARITLISALNESEETVGQIPHIYIYILTCYFAFLFLKCLRSCYHGNNTMVIIFL